MDRCLALILIVFFHLPMPRGWAAEEPAPDHAGDTNAESAILAAETNLVAEAVESIPSEATLTALKTWRAMLQIQGQLDMALLAIERNRREAETVAERNKLELGDKLKSELQDRLDSMERTLQTERERERVTLLNANERMLMLVGGVAGVGLLAMFLASVFHLRAMKGFTRLMASPVYRPTPETLSAPTLPSPAPPVLEAAAGGGGNSRLLAVIETLEKRVVELEHTSGPNSAFSPPSESAEEAETPQAPKTSAKNGSAHASLEDEASPSIPAKEPGSPDESSARAAAEEMPDPTSLSVWLGKGQALLNLGQAEPALQCFESALIQFPEEAELFVKKGTALEKLERWTEAIESYNQAIALKNDLTLAYLFKGGVCNRMERYDEALACYEQALKTQKRTAAKA